jgi:hypothetical protein
MPRIRAAAGRRVVAAAARKLTSWPSMAWMAACAASALMVTKPKPRDLRRSRGAIGKAA